MSDRNWTPEQTLIFAWFAAMLRNLVVRARAGTGKTTTIIAGIARATRARAILVCAFNKRIQVELAAKITDPRCTVKTLHAIGMSFLGRVKVNGNREIELARALVCDGESPDTLSAHDREAIPMIAKLAVKIKEIAPFGTAKDAEDLAWRFDCMADEKSPWTVERIAGAALEVCKRSQVPGDSREVSFADMLYLPVVLGLVRPRWDLVIVDEAQDMSPTQILLAKACCAKGGRIVVVGDDRQAIYGFRGADSGTIDNLKAELAAEELSLTVTHRCPKGVVAYARTLVPDYQAAPEAPEGTIDSITFATLADHVRPGDFVLSRKNAPLMGVCLGLVKRGIRAKVQGKDLGATLRALIKRLRPAGVSDLMAKVEAWKAKEIKRAEARGNGVGDARIQTVTDTADMVVALAEDCRDLPELDARIGNMFEDCDDTAGAPFVVCSSVHKAKGLEARRVFILADTLYPGGKVTQEEQNIEYVAVTRSQDRLTWVTGS